MRPSVGIGVLICASTIVLGGIVAGSGCTIITNDSLPDDAGKFDGTTDGAAPVCATCLSQECTGQWAVCFDDPGCLAVAKRTGSAACALPDSGSADGGADPLALHAAFAACNGAATTNGAACATDCTGTTQPSPCSTGDAGGVDSGTTDASDDGGAATDAGNDGGDASIADASAADADAGTAPVDPVVACTSCVSSKCGDAKKACAIGSECAAYLECTFAAADAAAADECGRQHATGKTAAAELATCTRVGCSNACGF